MRSLAKAGKNWRSVLGWVVMPVCLLTASTGVAEDVGDERGGERLTIELTLRELFRAVLERNESLQVRTLEVEISRRQAQAERGVFEPDFVASYDHVDTQKQNTTQERASTGLTPTYGERNDVYNAGLESLVPTGAKVRLGYTLRDLRNTLQDNPVYGTGFTNGEYASFVGVNVVQPLLKNAGFAATMAGIRLAATASELAFQEYRRQLMTILSTAEANYWNLYLAQRQVMALKESVELADTVLKDNLARLETGVGSELEVMEARAGLALRRTKLAEAQQLLHEAHNHVTALYLDRNTALTRRVVAVDEPHVRSHVASFGEAWETTFNQNPDYLIQRKKLAGEHIRLAYTRNQRLPSLDLKASYGLNGLGDSPSDSFGYIERSEYPAWTVGFEFRVPLAGGSKPRHELHAAKLRVEQALISLKELETQIASAIDTTREKVRSTGSSIGHYQEVVMFNEDLLKTQLARLEVGRVESRKVLEVEGDLINARNALAESQVQHQRALLELELIQGTLLHSRGFEKPQKEIEVWTAVMLSEGKLNRRVYQRMVDEALRSYPPVEDAGGESSGGAVEPAPDIPGRGQENSATP